MVRNTRLKTTSVYRSTVKGRKVENINTSVAFSFIFSHVPVWPTQLPFLLLVATLTMLSNYVYLDECCKNFRLRRILYYKLNMKEGAQMSVIEFFIFIFFFILQGTCAIFSLFAL